MKLFKRPQSSINFDKQKWIEWKIYFRELFTSLKEYTNRNRNKDTGLVSPDLSNPSSSPTSFAMHPVHYELQKTMRPANSGGIYKTPPKEK